MVTIMSAAMLMSSLTVSMAFPVGVHAENYDTSDRIIPDDDQQKYVLEEDTLEEVIDNDTIHINGGVIDINNGTVESNANQILTNNGAVNYNEGNVADNYGTVEQVGGTVENQYDGTVSGSGTVTNHLGGLVAATEEDGITIENYYSGDLLVSEDVPIVINNSYGDEDAYIENENITVINQYHSVDITSTTGAEFAHVAFEPDPLKNNVYTQTIKNGTPVDIQGTITVKADSNYEIKVLNSDMGGETDNIGYALIANDDGSYTVRLSFLNKNVTLTPNDLGLLIQMIQNQPVNPAPPSEPAAIVDNNSSSSATGGSNNTFNATKYLLEKANANSAGNKELVLDYSNYQNNLSSDDIRMICNVGGAAKTCLFSINGEKYILHIPPIDTSSEAYIKGLAVLELQSGGVAGPEKIAELFESLGVTCTKVAAAEAARPAGSFETQIAAAYQTPAAGAPGGTLTIASFNSPVLDRDVVSAILQIGNADVEILTFIDDVYGRITIPAASNIAKLLRTDGTISIRDLAANYGFKSLVDNATINGSDPADTDGFN